MKWFDIRTIIIGKLLSGSRFFFFPTRSEGQGIVILLAMSYGIPVVTTNLGGITDMMMTSNNIGYLVEMNDLEGFVYATKNILNNRE